MPLTLSDFPDEMQMAFFIHDMLTDIWEGMSGMYMGKDWGGAPLLFDIYEVDDRKTILYLAKLYERLLMSYRAEEAEQRRKAEERKNKKTSAGGGGKTYTYNVTG